MMGKVIMSGIVPLLKAPVTGIQAGMLAVGSVVKLMEGSTAVEYLVVNQGIPQNSSLYDDSCDGTWLLRKDIHSERPWHTSDVGKYESSAIHTWLNGDFFSSLGSVEQAAIKQVKIPYCVGNDSSTIKGGANGLSCKVFLLSGYEVGWTVSDNSYFRPDGVKLDYFTASFSGGSKRIANFNGSAAEWWLRSPCVGDTYDVWRIHSNGSVGGGSASKSFGVRPALVLPKTALFDEATLLLKGAA